MFHLMRLRLVYAVVLGLFGWSSAASAAPITFRFQGVVTQSSIPGTGQNFNGFFTFDDAVADARPGDPTTGVYVSPDTSPYGYSFRSASFFTEFTGAMQEIAVNDGPLAGDPAAFCGPSPGQACDLYQWDSQDFIDNEFFFLSLVSFGVVGSYNLGLVPSDALITDPPDASLFLCDNGLPASDSLPCGRGAYAAFVLSDGPVAQQVSGYVTHLVRVRRGVPEPSVLMLFSVIGGGLIVRLRQRKQQS